jgi:ribose transport system substrate-binding protein
LKIQRNRKLLATMLSAALAATGLAISLGQGVSGASSHQYITLAQATTQFKAASAPVKWNGPTTPAAAPKSENVAILACDLSLQGCAVATDSVQAAATALGWTNEVLPVTDYPEQFDTALTDKATVIISIGFPASSLPAVGLAQAKADKIPVVDINGDCTVGPTGCSASQSFSEQAMGRLQGLALMVLEKGNVKLLSFIDNELSDGYENNQYTIAWLKLHDKGFQLESTTTLLEADSAATIGSLTVAAIRKSPKANSLLTPYDPEAGVQVPAIVDAGLGNKITVVSNIGLTQNLEWVAKNYVERADVANELNWTAWAAIDRAIRLLDGLPQVAENVPLKIMTAANAPKNGVWNDDGVNYEAKYEALWGIS